MPKTELIFISTGADHLLINQLIDSIQGNTQGQKVKLIIVNQGAELNFNSKDVNLEIHTISVNQRLSLSAARNVALKNVFEQNISAHHIMFPDDDSTYKSSFFKAYKNLDKEQAYLAKICNFEDGSDYRSYPKAKRCGKEALLPWVASVSLLLPYNLVKKVGFFDEKLGVGAQWGSSEDLDYYLRCAQYQEFCFLPEIKTYHPSRFGKYQNMNGKAIRSRFKAYTDGFLAVHYRFGLENKLNLFPHRALGGAMLSMAKLRPVFSWQYVWLYFYRQKAMAAFQKIRNQEPEKLAPHYDI